MARVPDVLLTGCGEEDEGETHWRNEVSLYDSAHRLEPFSALKTTGLEAPQPILDLPTWGEPGQGSSPFADADLLEMLHHNLVEEELTPFTRAAFGSAARALKYRFDPPPKISSVQDVDHKNLFLGRIQNQDRLYAGHVEAVKTEKLVLLFYHSWDSRAGLTRLVVLGIGSQQYLSCREKAGRPQLELERVETPLKATLGKDMARFLFKFQGTSSDCRFESEAYPGWFLATADAENQPVRLHNRLGQQFYMDFYLPDLLPSPVF